MVIPFPGGPQLPRADVGGKAASLIRMCAAGLPVPPGVVLASAFFAPWFDRVMASEGWTHLTHASTDEWPALCSKLQQHALALPLTATQRDALNALHSHLRSPSSGQRFAVRSSSPEEDLASASFAGSYETRMGVSAAGLEDAVRACFVSSLDLRVFTYKAERQFDLWAPRIAVVVQRQIASDVAGVGFSLNPVTNDYDEAVINANWGLGTSVVDGRVSPDHFVISKIDSAVVEETRGDKRVSAWLDAGGGTVERENHRPAERALTDAQLRELTGMIVRIEALYEVPVDVEWAYAGGRLHVLQARPITTYVPLPPEMVTRPGERRRLYGDAALSKGMTTNAPISPLGLDNMESMFSGIVQSWVGPLKRDVPPQEAVFFFAGGRMYINYSNILWLASPAMLAKGTAATDTLMAQILGAIDPKRYRAEARPPWMSLRLLRVVPRALWHLRGFAWNMGRTVVSPERAHRVYRQRIDALERELREQLDGGLPLEAFRRTYQARLSGEIFEVAMPAFVAGTLPLGGVTGARHPERKALADALATGATDNVVVEMGISLRRLAALLEPGDWRDLEQVARRIEQRKMPSAFMEAWDRFLAAFGWRGPLESDVASPRYADDPRLALRQMSCMSLDDDRYDPEVAHRRLVEERKRAYGELARSMGPLRRMLLRRVYRLIDLFAGARDTPKHLVVLFNYGVRKRVLAEGHRLAREGRIDVAEDVFSLTFAELKAASEDTGLDLRAASAERRRFRARLDAQVKRFPAAIDSRGRILRPPPRADTPGVWSGMPVSPGVVSGPVKTLHSPHDKRVEKGDVLVAYTTDPGWTPLFVNAAAIVLEVGGALQHGAVVAREYGKPCVVGIDQVVATLPEGALVEVDGTMGTVRLLP